MDLDSFGLREDTLLADQREVFEYWTSLKRDADGLPARADFKPARIVRRLPHVSLIDVAFDAARFRFRLAGTGLRDIFGEELTGKDLSQMPFGGHAQGWYEVYRQVARERRPAQGYTPLTWRDRPSMVQAWLRLPFADESGAVNVILGYDRFLPIEKIGPKPPQPPAAARRAQPAEARP